MKQQHYYLLTLLLFLMPFIGYSQVARELKVNKNKANNYQDYDKLNALYHKLYDEKNIELRGSKTVYRGEKLGAIQFPVGGIGTGCIQFDGHATPRFWQIFNNMTHDFVPNSFMAIKVDDQTRALQTKDVGTFKAMKSLSMNSEFPFINYRFDNEWGVDIQLEVYNPFIPTNLKDSEIPVVFYKVKVKNNSKQKKQIGVLASQQNAVGFTKVEKLNVGNSFADRFEFSLKRELVKNNQSKFYKANQNSISKNGKQVALMMKSDYAKSEQHYGEMALISLDNPNVRATADWGNLEKLKKAFLSKQGLEQQTKSSKSSNGETYSGAITSSIELKPNQEREFSFALVWYFPNGLNGGHMKKWDAWGKGRWVGEGNNYANYWNNFEALCSYVKENHQRLESESRDFADSFYQTNLPYWMVERLSNQLAILKSRTIFHDKKNYVGLWEGCGSGDGSCSGNCNHVWHYAQAHARLFPQLTKQIRSQSFNAIKKDGQLPYRQPNGSPAFDGQLGEIIACYREFLVNGEKTWLKEYYPRIKSAMDYIINKHDEDKDGWLSDKAKHTTYDASMTGNPSVLSLLYLTALKSVNLMALELNNNTDATYYQTIFKKGRAKQDQALWNGEYFNQIAGEKKATDYNNGCHSDQLLGQWWANQIGIAPIYTDSKNKLATQAILRYNFLPNLENYIQKARRYAKDHEAGMVVTTWPHKERPAYASGYSDEVWTSFEYTTASLLFNYGMSKDALKVMRSGYERYDGELKKGYKTANGWGNFGFSGNPFGDDECGQFYSRALANWSVLLSAQGFNYNAHKASIAFAPKWKPENHKSFFSASKAWGVFSQTIVDNDKNVEISVNYGQLKLKEISLDKSAKSIKVYLNGKEIQSKFNSDDNKLKVQFSEVLLNKNDKLKVEAKL
jgi:uncharacterized protein (DUF608 family)